MPKKPAKPTQALIPRPNINQRLLDQVERDLWKYDCGRCEIAHVLLDAVSFEERQKRAIDFISGVLVKHGKQEALHYLSDLAKVEQGIRALQPKQRDHVVHAVRTFLLGVFLNERFLDGNADTLQCKLAFLLHDVGYPLEMATRVGQPFGETLNRIAIEIGVTIEPVRFVAPQLAGIELLTGGKNSIDLIRARLVEWGVDLDASLAYKENAMQGKVCHGVISALAVLRVLDMLFTKNNPNRMRGGIVVDGVDWNQTIFERDNVSACAAIFLHNLKKKWFAPDKIQRQLAPVAFILRLADALQEWERPSGKSPRGLSPSSFDIEVVDGRLLFHGFRLNRLRKAEIRADIDAALNAPDVEIV
jgi:hypothetical protein